MNPFLLSPRERLTVWKNLRLSLGDEASDDDKLNRVARFWGQCPIQRYALDTDHPRSWLTCWEMLHYNDFDRNAVALGMEMTLRLAGWATNRLKLLLINDHARFDCWMVLKIDDQKLLNYNHNSVCELPKSGFDVLCAYQFNGTFYHQSVT
jgi:hypothetical protein